MSSKPDVHRLLLGLSRKKWENVDYIEVWSKPFPPSKSANERAFSLWTWLLDKGYHLAATYGKDWHKKSDETEPYGCTYIGTESETLTGAEIKKPCKTEERQLPWVL